MNDGWYRGKCMCWVHMLTRAQTKTPGSHTSRRKESKSEMRCSVTHTHTNAHKPSCFSKLPSLWRSPTHSDGNITAAACVEDGNTMPPYYTKKGTYIKRNVDNSQKSLSNRVQMMKRKAWWRMGVRWAMFCPLCQVNKKRMQACWYTAWLRVWHCI